MTTPTSRPSLRRKLIATTALMGGLAGVSPAWGQLSTPNGPTIDPGNGAAAFAHSVNGAGAAALNGDPGTITVTVNENNTIINWSAFDIKAGSTARFDNGVGGQIAVLNRDLSGNSSLIEGALSNPDASISLYLTNPSGVVFGSGANVNVGSLIASTLGLTDLDFRDGDGSLNFTGASGAITVNTGATLTAATGNLALIGAQVDVQGGTLGAANGNVNFIAATNVTVSDSLSPLGFTIKTGTAVANALSVKANVSGKNITLGYVDTNGAIDAILAAGTFTATDAAATDKGIVLGIPSGSGALDGALTGSSATNVTLSGDLTLEGGAANVSFAGTVDGAVADSQALTVNTTGTTSFAGAIGSAAPLASLTTNVGGATRLAASVDASGNILFNDAVVLTGSVGVSSTAGSIAFASTVDGVTAGASALSANTLGTTTFGGVVGGDKSLASLATDVGGATNIGADIIAAGTISFDDSVSITGATVGLTSTGGGAISFNDTVSGATAGANALTVNTTGATLFNGVVGATALKSLETNAGGTTQLAANVTATGALTYNDDVVIAGATIAITSTGNDAVSFLAKVDAAGAGANALTVNTTGDTVFGGVVGTTALKSLETNAGGTTKLAADVTATGAITYNDDVVITGAAVSVTSTGNEAVSFVAKVDGATAGANALTVNTTGATVFGGVVGTTALKALTTNAGGTTSLGGSVSVADADPTNKGAVSFNDDVLLAANATVESADEGDILFGGTVQSAVADAFKSLTVNTDGTTTFTGAVGNASNKNLLALTTDAAGVTVVSGGIVSTTGGDQSFGDAVKITGNTAFTAVKAAGDTGTASISFATLDGDSAVTPRALTVNSKGAVTFNGAVGSSPSKSLSDIDVDAVGDVKILSTIAAAGKTTVDSTAASILFCGATCSINAGGAVELTAMLNVSGVAAAGGTVSDVIVGSANSGADLAIESGSNLRIGSATAANDLSFKVAGAVSGLPAVTAVTGAGDLTGASIKVRAGETAADIVRLNQVTANGAPAAGFIDIRGGAIAINGATANNGITLAATAGGIYLGSANAGSISLTSTIAPDTTTILNRPDLDPSDGVPADTIGTSFGFANLTATAGTVKVAALDGASPVGGYAQLGTVQAGTDVSAAATNGMVANKAVATAGAINLFTQTGLLSLGVSLDGTTALDASTAGTSVRLRKAGTVSELRAGTVASGTANTGSSDVTILSATDARLANLAATGADLTVRTGVDLAFDPVAPVAEARAGAATGLKASSTALDGGYGRALLSASAKSAATGGAITVDAGTLIQLGIVTADKRITLDAGTNSTVGDLKFRDGAIDVSQAVSRDTDGLGIDELAQGLTFTAFNDGDPVAQPSGILIGTMQSGGLTAADLTAGLSRSTGAILVTTTGTVGDIAIGAGLTAEGATLATGLIAIDSARSVLLRGGAFDLVSGTAADPRVRSVVGDVTITAARDVDGLPANFATGLALVDDVVIGSGNGSAGLTIKADGNLRIGSATSTNGAVSLTAAGAVSGLPIPFTAPTTALAGAVEGRVVTVTASADTGRYARLDSIVGSQSATADAHTIAVGTLDAPVATLISRGGGVYVGASLGGSLAVTGAGPLDTTLLQRPTAELGAQLISDLFGATTITAGTNATVTATNGYAQLGVVTAGTAGATGDILVSAATGLVVERALATLGSIDLRTNDGLLSLGVSGDGTTALPESKAGTFAVLRKRGLVSELRVGTLTSGLKAGPSDITVLSATNARIGSLTALGGAIAIEAGADLTFAALTGTEARPGAVTGLKVASNGLDGGYGRAVLTTKTSGDIGVIAGTLIQLGETTASGSVALKAGTDSLVGDLKARDGAIDVESVTAAGALVATTFNDDPASRHDIRFGVATSGANYATDAVAAASTVGGTVTVTTTGTAGDIVFGRALTAGGSIAADSVDDILFGTQAADLVRSTGGGITLAATDRIAALPAMRPAATEAQEFVISLGEAPGPLGGGQIRIGDLTSGADLTVDGGGDVRIRNGVSSAGNIGVEANGSVTGLSTKDSGDGVTGGFLQASGSISATAGPSAQFNSLVAGGSINVGAGLVAVGSADAGGAITLSGVTGVHLGVGNAGTTATIATTSLTDRESYSFDPAAGLVAPGYGFANLTAAADGKAITVAAGLDTPGMDQFGVAQLGQVIAGTTKAQSAGVQVGIAADEIAVQQVLARNGSVFTDARNGPLYAGTVEAGTAATLIKRGVRGLAGDEMRLASLTTGKATDGAGAATLLTATDARIGAVSAAGGDITVRSGVDVTGTDPMALTTTEQRAGAVTGLATTGSKALNDGFGRADLTSTGAIIVDAGTLIQLGKVQAGGAVLLDAGSAPQPSSTDAFKARDGAIDVSQAVGGDFTFTTFSDAATGPAGILLGTVQVNGAPSIDPASFAGDTDLRSESSGIVKITTTGRGDIAVGAGLRADGAITFDSIGSVLLRGKNSAAGVQTARPVESVNGDVMIDVVRSVTGFPAPQSTAFQPTSDAVVRSIASQGGIDVSVGTDLRLDTATSSKGDIKLQVAGAVSGTGSAADLTGAGDLIGSDVKVTSTGTQDGDIVRLTSITATGTAEVKARAIAVETVSGKSGVTLTAGAGGLYTGTVNSALGPVTITSARTGELDTRLLSRPGAADTIRVEFGASDLDAAGKITVQTQAGAPVAGYAQLGDVLAGQSIAIEASTGIVADRMVATAGAIDLFTADGLLSLGATDAGTAALADASSAGTTARLRKLGATSELRLGTLTSGGAATVLSATDARIASLTTNGGDLVVRSGAGFERASSAVSEARAGAVTGLKSGSTGLNTDYGRAGLKSSGTLIVSAGTLIQLGKAEAGGDLTVTAGTATVPDRDGAIDVSSIKSTAGRAELTAFNDAKTGASGILIGTKQAGGQAVSDGTAELSSVFGNAAAGGLGLLIQTDDGALNDPTRSEIAVGRGLEVKNGAADLLGSGDVRVVGIPGQQLSAPGNIRLISAGDVSGINEQAVSFAAARNTQGAASAPGANLTSGAGTVTVDAIGLAQLGRVAADAAGKNIAVTSDFIELTGTASSDAITLLNRAAGVNGTVLGGDQDPVAGPAYLLTKAEFALLDTKALVVDSGAQNVAIGDLPVSAVTGDQSLNLFTTGDVTITGAFAQAAGTAPARSVRIGGSAADGKAVARAIIGTTGAGGGTKIGSVEFASASVELFGNNIGFGLANLVGGANGLFPNQTGAGAIDSGLASQRFEADSDSALYRQTFTGVGASGQTYLRANSLKVRYGGFALFQNTAVPSTDPALSSAGAVIGTGLTPNTLVLDPIGTANTFALFGSVAGRTGTEAALLGTGVNPTGTANLAQSRINGCLIGNPGGCANIRAATPNVFIFDQQISIISAADLLVAFDPVIGANNETLFSDLGTVGFPDEEDEDQCDPNDPTCRNREGTQ